MKFSLKRPNPLNLCWLFLCLPLSIPAQSLQPVAADAPQGAAVVPATSYAVVARDGNQKLWQKVTFTTNDLSGAVTTITNSYIELATSTGHLVNDVWTDSSDQIEITKTGAQATNSMHKLAFLGNINMAGAINITLPEGDKHLTSTPIGISFYDTASGKSVMIAELTNSAGQLSGSGNQALYPACFSGLDADLLYVNKIDQVEQLVVLRQQLPDPSEWDLDPTSTLVQVISEFFDPPSPVITQRTKRGAIDEHLDFGIMQSGRGVAFAIDSETNTVPVTKQWLLLDGHQCLVESVPFNQLAPLLEGLAPPPEQARLQGSPDSILHRVADHHLLPARKLATKSTSPMRLAGLAPRIKGVAIDWSFATTQTNVTFQSDKTYYVSSNVTLSGAVVFEGGTVVKYTNSAGAKLTLSASASLAFNSAPYRPVVFTSKDDNTVGDTITGSTGSPTNSTGATFLDWPAGSPTYQYLRFSYAGTAIHAYSPQEVKHCQFFRCVTAIAADDDTDLKLRNVLFSVCGTAVSIGSYSSMEGEHVTADQLTKFFDAPLCTAKLTNSILTAVTTITTNVTFYYSVTNSSSAGFYQTVGAASYYLADGSTNRNAGSTNINSSLRTDLGKQTTYPPIELTNNFTTDTTLSPLAGRDTDLPDLGYHFDPLDYIVSGRTLTNSTLTLTNGVVLGTYGASSGYGVYIRKSGNLISTGTPNILNQIVRYNTVQEQSSTNWSASTVAPSVKISADAGTPAKGSFRFTGWSLLGANGYHVYASYTGVIIPFAFQDCQFRGGAFEATQSSMAFTNCLFERPNLNMDDDGGNNYVYYAFNNLFRVGSVTFNKNGSTTWIVKDSLFDQCLIAASSGITHDYNSYVTNKNRLSPNGTHDKILTNNPVYLTTYLGSYYYPTNGGLLSTLIDVGSRNATNATLYHYTTTTNQVKEAISTVDIGFHYVATDSSGIPLDYDTDGIPDYMEDANGNGTVDSGETDWQSAGDLGLKVLITGLATVQFYFPNIHS